VFHEQTREEGAGGGGPLERNSPACKASPTCMRIAAAGACVRILVLVWAFIPLSAQAYGTMHTRGTGMGDGDNVECVSSRRSRASLFLEQQVDERVGRERPDGPGSGLSHKF
jgi:hypothetical protein